MRRPPNPVVPAGARVLLWLGLVLMVLPLPVMTVTEADLDGWLGDWDDFAQGVAFFAPCLGYPLAVAGRFWARVVRDAEATLPKRFGKAPGLRWIAGFARSFIGVAVGVILGIAVVMLAVAGLTALFTDGAFTFDDQPYGALGDGVLALVVGLLLATGAWLVLGTLLYGGIMVGYSLWRLGSRSAGSGEKTAAGMVVAAVLIVVGVTGVVVAGNAGLPADDVVVRGLMATAGALLLVVPLAYAIAMGWRRGQRPWGFSGRLDDAGKIIAALGRLVAAGVLSVWLVTALLRAWQP